MMRWAQSPEGLVNMKLAPTTFPSRDHIEAFWFRFSPVPAFSRSASLSNSRQLSTRSVIAEETSSNMRPFGFFLMKLCTSGVYTLISEIWAFVATELLICERPASGWTKHAHIASAITGVLFILASSLLCVAFLFLLFGKTFLILCKPTLQILSCLLQFVAVQQTASERLKKRASTNVIREFFVSFLIGTFRNCNKKLLVKRSETALHSTQGQAAFASDGPVRKTKRQIVKRLGFKLREQRTLERVLECR